MDYFTLVLGILALGYGIFSCIMRFVKPSMFKKLEPMKERWGRKVGNAIHFFSYIIVPIAVGGVFIIARVNGISFFNLNG